MFLQAFKPNAEIAPGLSDGTKGVVSTLSRVTNEALHAVGVDSAKLDFFGHAKVHPLGEAQYSQVPFRYGDYVAKLGVFPDSPALEQYLDKESRVEDPGSACARLSVAFFKSEPGGVQPAHPAQRGHGRDAD